MPGFDQEAYHQFADQRTWLGVANFWNVVSNLLFLAVGAWGLGRARSIEWRVVFGGVAMVAAGSGYYHLAPDTARLFWDRVPMTIAFMAAFAIVIGKRGLLWPFVAAGVGSAMWWRATGQLAPYALVQFVPLIAIPMLLIWRKRPRDWWGVIGLYVIAKLFELGDRPIFELVGFVSGHTLKHVAAAGACVWMVRAMEHR